MKLAILHISDLHFREAPDRNPILSRPEKIAAALRGLSEPQLEACFVAVTGDIAFSGKEAEYAVALEFFTSLRKELAEFRFVPNGFIFIPGNHDCDFENPNTIRDAIIRDTIRRQSGIKKIDITMAAKCLEPQSSYTDFVSIFSPDTNDCPSNIHSFHEYKVNGIKVLFQCYNTAWMSEIHERQGQLYFPTHLIEEHNNNDADVTITLLHHPFRWFESDNARGLTTHVEEQTDTCFPTSCILGGSRGARIVDCSRQTSAHENAAETGGSCGTRKRLAEHTAARRGRSLDAAGAVRRAAAALSSSLWRGGSLGSGAR